MFTTRDIDCYKTVTISQAHTTRQLSVYYCAAKRSGWPTWVAADTIAKYYTIVFMQLTAGDRSPRHLVDSWLDKINNAVA